MTAVALLGRAVALVAAGGPRADLKAIVEVDAPAAFAERLTERRVTTSGRLTAAGAELVIAGPDLGQGRIVVELRAGAVRVALDLAGEPLPDAFAGLPLALHYPAGELPSDHRWWSDVGGLLMVGELTAASG